MSADSDVDSNDEENDADEGELPDKNPVVLPDCDVEGRRSTARPAQSFVDRSPGCCR